MFSLRQVGTYSIFGKLFSDKTTNGQVYFTFARNCLRFWQTGSKQMRCGIKTEIKI